MMSVDQFDTYMRATSKLNMGGGTIVLITMSFPECSWVDVLTAIGFVDI